MNPIRKGLAIIVLGAASIGTWFGVNSLVQNVQFARAEQQVQAARDQLNKAEDLSTVFRDVGKAIEPSVVQIEVHKSVPGAPRQFFGPDDMLRRFFQEHPNMVPPGGNNNNNDQGDDDQDNNGPSDQDQGNLEEVGKGSGVIMEYANGYGYILTNNHVAGGATKLTVTLNDGREIKGGTVLGADAKSDLAVVRIKTDGLIPAKWGDSDAMQRGDWVLAFGSPFGYIGSMTHGIISATHRNNTEILGNQGYEDFLQVDAPINPGNSGGPLVNIHGEVIGINTAIATRSGGFQGIGFAIPINQAKVVYAALKDKGKVTRGWLGVSIKDVENAKALAEKWGYTGDKGVLVEQTYPNTPADGKLQAGDIITQMNGAKVDNIQQLRNIVAATTPGQDASFTVFRDGKDQPVTIKIGAQPEDLMAFAHHESGDNDANGDSGQVDTVRSLGLHLSNLTDDLAQHFGVTDLKEGAVITGVERRSLAAKAGLQPGDVITRVGKQPVTNAKDAIDAISKEDVKKGIVLYITNHEGSQFILIDQNPDNEK